MSSKFQNDAIFWVEVEKIHPNPYQPRRDFNEERLRDLAESIRQYGVLQPLTVTRKEETKDDGGLKVSYELIAGERRHRASSIAGLKQVPVIIRSGQEDSQVKLELAIIENLQREDLNPIERAEAFDQLAQEFDFTHKKIAEKIGKSREYVSNSMRLLKLPEKIKQAIISGQMTEGHARPIMMLRDNPEEQETLFKEVVHKGLTVREAESIARRDAQDKVRKKENKIDPETKALEDRLSDTFGTRVKIEERDVGGKLVIDFFSNEDLENIIKLIQAEGDMEMGDMMEHYVESVQAQQSEKTTGDDVSGDAQDDGSEQSEDGDASGKSMAETLGTMIKAARENQKRDGKKTEAKTQTPENDTEKTADNPKSVEESEVIKDDPVQSEEETNSEPADSIDDMTEGSMRADATDSNTEAAEANIDETDSHGEQKEVAEQRTAAESEHHNQPASNFASTTDTDELSTNDEAPLAEKKHPDTREEEEEGETNRSLAEEESEEPEPGLADFSIGDEMLAAHDTPDPEEGTDTPDDDISAGEDAAVPEPEDQQQANEDDGLEEEDGEDEDIYSVSNFSI